MNLAKFLVILFAGVGALVAPAAPVTKAPKPKPMMAVNFIYWDRDDDAVTFLIESQGPALRTLSLSSGALEGPYLVERADSLALYDSTPPPVTPGATPVRPGVEPPSPPVLHRVKIPPGSKNVVVLIAGRLGKITSSIAIDQSLSVLPAGRMALVSYLDEQLAVRVGDARVVVPARGRVLAAPGTKTPIPLQVAIQRGNEWRKVVSRAIPGDPSQRAMVLLLPDGPDAVNVVRLAPAPEDPPEPEPEQR